MRFEVEELDRAGLSSPDEDEALSAEEDLLAGAVGHREAAAAVLAVLGDGAVRDELAEAVGLLTGRTPFGPLRERLASLGLELDDVAADLRDAAERLDEDPERLAAVRERRQLLRDLRRKYGDTLADVLAYQVQAQARLAELMGLDDRLAGLEAEQAAVRQQEAVAAAAVAAARGVAAPDLARAVQGHLVELAMSKAVVDVTVAGDGDAGEVTFLLAANPGDPPAPLARVASGGELARAMLALRLVLTEAPETLVFDEVDAGIGGEAALAVGRALGRLGRRHQVLVVTHLAQVAAFADRQVSVDKRVERGRTVASARDWRATSASWSCPACCRA